MEILSFATLSIPFILVVYAAFLLFIRPTRAVFLASLLAGLVVGIINIAVELLAYYASWWHYTLNGLILHLPLPFYISSVLFYGSVAYLLIWRFWKGRGHWFALFLLIGLPIFGMLRDIYGGVTHTSYAIWDNVPLAILATIGMWLLMFYAGLLVFNRLAPTYETVQTVREDRVEIKAPQTSSPETTQEAAISPEEQENTSTSASSEVATKDV